MCISKLLPHIFTQYLAKVCPRAKPLVFDPWPPITAALKHERLKKSVKIAISTAFYGKNDTE